MTLKELGHKECHSCYVCFDDWKFGRKRCWQRQFDELLIKHLTEVDSRG